MLDALIDRRVGDLRPIYAEAILPAEATGAVNGAIGEYVISDVAGEVIASGEIDGQTIGSTMLPRVWFDWDTAGVAPGFYRAVVTFNALISDGVQRRYVSAIGIRLLPA